MAVSYKKLFKILIDRDMKKKEFRDFVGISYSTMSKLEKGENTTVEVLEKICLKLGCGIEDTFYFYIAYFHYRENPKSQKRVLYSPFISRAQPIWD